MARFSLISAVVLALSFLLPLTKSTSSGATRSVSYEYFFTDPHWFVPLVFFLPLALVGARRWKPIALATPLIVAGLAYVLGALVYLADFTLFFGPQVARAYGGYVALVAMACVLAGTTALAIRAWSSRVLLVGVVMLLGVSHAAASDYAMYVWTEGFDADVPGCDETKLLAWDDSLHPECYTHTWDDVFKRQWLWDTVNRPGREVGRVFVSDIKGRLEPSGSAFYYLVRIRESNLSDWGRGSSGAPRDGACL